MLVLTDVDGQRVRVNPIYMRSYSAIVLPRDGVDVVATELDLGEGRRLVVQEKPDQIDALFRLMGGGLFFIDEDCEPRRFTSAGVKAGQRSQPRSKAGGR